MKNFLSIFSRDFGVESGSQHYVTCALGSCSIVIVILIISIISVIVTVDESIATAIRIKEEASAESQPEPEPETDEERREREKYDYYMGVRAELEPSVRHYGAPTMRESENDR